ncbi:MAG: DUF4136 domain-containing protein [Myxococcota bacterium]
MHPRLPKLPSLALVLATALACASNDAIPVSTTHDPLARFPAQATFSWDEAAISLPDMPEREATDALFREVAEEAFAARGYQAGAPPTNFRLSYHYAVNERIGPDVAKAVGSVSILMTESDTGRRVWLGFGRAEVYVGLTREERKARLRDALDRMLAKFPPSGRPPE